MHLQARNSHRSRSSFYKSSSNDKINDLVGTIQACKGVQLQKFAVVIKSKTRFTGVFQSQLRNMFSFGTFVTKYRLR